MRQRICLSPAREGLTRVSRPRRAGCGPRPAVLPRVRRPRRRFSCSPAGRTIRTDRSTTTSCGWDAAPAGVSHYARDRGAARRERVGNTEGDVDPGRVRGARRHGPTGLGRNELVEHLAPQSLPAIHPRGIHTPAPRSRGSTSASARGTAAGREAVGTERRHEHGDGNDDRALVVVGADRRSPGGPLRHPGMQREGRHPRGMRPAQRMDRRRQCAQQHGDGEHNSVVPASSLVGWGDLDVLLPGPWRRRER
jgi:hypothetical protein